MLRKFKMLKGLRVFAASAALFVASPLLAQQAPADVVDWIIEITCKDRSYGARPLRRAIQRYIEDPLSEELIRGHLRGGNLGATLPVAIEVYLEAGQLTYRPAGELEAGRKLA